VYGTQDSNNGCICNLCTLTHDQCKRHSALTSSAVIPSIIRGGCYVLKTITPTETRSAAIAVSLPSVLRGAGVPVINACPEPSADHVCCGVN